MMFKPPRAARIFSTKEYASSKDADVGYSFDCLRSCGVGKKPSSEPTHHRGLGEDATSVFRPRVFSSAELKEGLNDESTQNELKEILRSDGILGVNTASGDFGLEEDSL